MGRIEPSRGCEGIAPVVGDATVAHDERTDVQVEGTFVVGIVIRGKCIDDKLVVGCCRGVFLTEAHVGTEELCRRDDDAPFEQRQ